jgi:hypothetical protein
VTSFGVKKLSFQLVVDDSKPIVVMDVENTNNLEESLIILVVALGLEFLGAWILTLSVLLCRLARGYVKNKIFKMTAICESAILAFCLASNVLL